MAVLAAPRHSSSLWRELQLRRWGALHRRVAAQPLFAACSRQEIRTIVRWGDEVTVDAGAVLWREDTIGFHFVVVESGELLLTSEGRDAVTLHHGDYTGEVAILSFGPQTATLTATNACRLFVVGRAPLLSLVHTPGVRAGLFGDLDERAMRERIREMRAEGHAEWLRRFPAVPEAATAVMPESLHFYVPPQSSAPPRWVPQFDHAPNGALPTVPSLSRRFRILAAAVVASAVLIATVAVAITARPPVAVVTPAAPVDLTDDFTVRGAATYPINGHFVLTAVRIARPTYAQWIAARLGHDTTAPLATDQVVAQQVSKSAFGNAKLNAVHAVASALALDPARVEVAMRQLDIGGSSVGLVYALALADLLDPADLARGRTIAATGELDGDGRVGAVRFVDEKARVAHAAGATLFLVPRGQAPHNPTMRVVEVATLADALSALRAMNG
jgi:PDZ domain-containing protein